MKKKDTKEIIRTALMLFLICAVSAAILGFVNKITAPKIAENSIKTADEARRKVLPEAEAFEEKTLPDGTVYYIGSEAATAVGYVFSSSASGYGGTINIMVGVDNNGVITGVSILSIDETPGLGMKAKKPDFLEQFTGKSGQLSVTKNSTAGESEIVAITSATITSRAVTKAVNTALAYYNEAAGTEVSNNG